MFIALYRRVLLRVFGHYMDASEIDGMLREMNLTQWQAFRLLLPLKIQVLFYSREKVAESAEILVLTANRVLSETRNEKWVVSDDTKKGTSKEPL